MHGESDFVGRPAELLSASSVLQSAGSCLIVTGEAGIGKTFFARQVARLLRDEHSIEVVRIRAGWGARSTPYIAFTGLLPQLLHDEHPTLSAALQTVSDALIRPGKNVLLLADDAQDYDAASLELLGALSAAPGVRVIITAREAAGSASWLLDRLERDGYADHIRLGPLSIAETRELASAIFRSEIVEPATAAHLHEASGGNPLLLSRYADSLHQAGSISVTGPVAAWNGEELAHSSIAELFSAELQRLSPAERAALLMIAVAEPLAEPLARTLCDAAALDSLALAAFITLNRDHRTPSYSVAHPLIAESARSSATPGELLSADLSFLYALPAVIPESSPDLALRAVAIAMDVGQPVRVALLRRAFTIACAVNDRRLALRIADVLLEHSASTLAERLDIRARRLPMLRAVDWIRYQRLTVADELPWLVLQPGDDDTLLKHRISLGFAVFDLLVQRDDDPKYALEIMQRLHLTLPQDNQVVLAFFAAELSHRLGAIGRFDAAMELSDSPLLTHHARVTRLTGAAMRCIILGQQGRIIAAREIAARELPLATKHVPEAPEAAARLFSGWYRVAYLAGRVQTMARMQRRLQENLDHRPAKFLADTNFLELSAGLLASAQGRWQDASAQLSGAVSRLTISDPTGCLVSVSAAAAFAFAAAGQEVAARTEIERCVALPLGDSRPFEGIIRLNLVRARLWLGDRSPAISEAERLADWAHDQRFALVEIRALHLLGLAGVRDPELAARAAALVPQIDGLIAPTIVENLRAMNDPDPFPEHPSTRRLARLGIWAPLPAGAELTPREREVAGFAALGYSSKWIAGKLQISRRTVETHLAHLYLKLDVTERDSLSERLIERQEHAEVSLWRAS